MKLVPVSDPELLMANEIWFRCRRIRLKIQNVEERSQAWIELKLVKKHYFPRWRASLVSIEAAMEMELIDQLCRTHRKDPIFEHLYRRKFGWLFRLANDTFAKIIRLILGINVTGFVPADNNRAQEIETNLDQLIRHGYRLSRVDVRGLCRLVQAFRENHAAIHFDRFTVARQSA